MVRHNGVSKDRKEAKEEEEEEEDLLPRFLNVMIGGYYGRRDGHMNSNNAVRFSDFFAAPVDLTKVVQLPRLLTH